MDFITIIDLMKICNKNRMFRLNYKDNLKRIRLNY